MKVNRQPLTTRRNILSSALWLAVCGLFLAFSLQPLALGQNLQQLQQEAEQNKRLQQLQQQRIQQLNRDLANLDAATKAQLANLRSLEAEINKLEKERADLSSQIELLGKQKAATEARIASLEKDLDGLKGRLGALLQSLYREKAARYLPLLRAVSFTDLAVRAKWVSVLGKTQTDLIDRINNTVQQLSEERIRLGLLVDDLNKKLAERQNRIKLLAQTRETVKVTVANLNQQKAGRQVVLRETLQAQTQLQSQLSLIQQKITAEVKRIQEERRRAEAEARRKAQEAQKQREQQLATQRQQQTQNQNNQQDGIRELPPVPKELIGTLQFPLRGGRVAQPYGSDGQTWEVIEGDSEASPVVSAADGVVIGVIFIANLGSTVLIQHSERISAQYTNLQDVRVSEGQQVSQGQLIGFTGGGALIPANQMWFRVQFDGQRYVDPSKFY